MSDGRGEVRYSFSVGIFRRRGSASGSELGQVHRPNGTSIAILFISLPAAQNKLSDWAALASILRRCPLCEQDSIVGHGRRRKQAHDEDHDWIPIRRGRCRPCHKTFTFLPQFSPPYGHYSLIARSQALRRYFLEGCSWEAAAPVVKDPDRIAAASTLRRWFRSLDGSQPPFSFLRGTLQAISDWFSRQEVLVLDGLPLSWPTLFPFLARFWPLRL